MKSILALVLCALLSLPAAATTKIEQTAAKMPIGMPVQVKLKDKQPINGVMGEVFPGGFELKVWVERKQETRRILFDEVTSLKRQGSGGVKGFAKTVVFVAAVVAVGVAVAGVVHR